MPIQSALPELALSKNGARYLLKRNASAEALLRKQSFLIDKAKAKREKFFDQERAMLLQHQAKQKLQTTQLCRLSTNPLTKIAGTEVEKKWGVDSDIILYTKQRGNQGFSLNNKLAFASFPSPTIWAVTNICQRFRDLSQLTSLAAWGVWKNSSACFLPFNHVRINSRETEPTQFRTRCG